MRITQRSSNYDNSIVLLDGRKIVDYEWANEETGGVQGGDDWPEKAELRRGNVVKIVLDAVPAGFERSGPPICALMSTRLGPALLDTRARFEG